jgi:hypothetical protein
VEFSKGKFGRPIDGHKEVGLAAIVEQQQGVLAESHSDGLFLKRQDRPRGSFGPMGIKGPLLPLGDGLGIDTVTFG